MHLYHLLYIAHFAATQYAH